MTLTQILLALAGLFTAIPAVYFGIQAWKNRNRNRNLNEDLSSNVTDEERFKPKDDTLMTNETQTIKKEKISLSRRIANAIRRIGGAIVYVFNQITSIFIYIINAIVRFIAQFIPAKGVKFQNLADFFAWFAGADLEIWKTMPSPVRKKRTGFGMLVFFAIVLSSILAAHTWGDIFHSIAIGIGIGCILFVVTWSLDRGVIIYMDNNQGSKAVVAARLAIVFAIAMINTTFIAMVIFDTEIKATISEKKDNEIIMTADSIAGVKAGYQQERDAEYANLQNSTQNFSIATNMLQATIDSQRAIIAGRRNELIGEVEGNVGSGKKGYGDAAKTKEAMLAQDEATLKTLEENFANAKSSSPEYLALQDTKAKYAKRDSELVVSINKADAYLEKQTKKITDRKQDGYADRAQAMWTVARDNKFLFFMVVLFFFAFESMAVLMKLMGGKDNYDDALQAVKHEALVKARQTRELELQTVTNGHQAAMKPLLEAEANLALILRNSLATITAADLTRFREIQSQLNDIENADFSNEGDGKMIKEIYRRKALALILSTATAEQSKKN